MSTRVRPAASFDVITAGFPSGSTLGSRTSISSVGGTGTTRSRRPSLSWPARLCRSAIDAKGSPGTAAGASDGPRSGSGTIDEGIASTPLSNVPGSVGADALLAVPVVGVAFALVWPRASPPSTTMMMAAEQTAQQQSPLILASPNMPTSLPLDSDRLVRPLPALGRRPLAQRYDSSTSTRSIVL